MVETHFIKGAGHPTVEKLDVVIRPFHVGDQLIGQPLVVDGHRTAKVVFVKGFDLRELLRIYHSIVQVDTDEEKQSDDFDVNPLLKL